MLHTRDMAMSPTDRQRALAPALALSQSSRGDRQLGNSMVSAVLGSSGACGYQEADPGS